MPGLHVARARLAVTIPALLIALFCLMPSVAASQRNATAPVATAASDAPDLDSVLRTFGTVPSADDLPQLAAPKRRRPINWPFNILGYLASALVFATFWMKVPMRLRQVGIASNVVFISYGTVGHLYPILILHAILLPLNVARLRELQRIVAKIQRAATNEFPIEWLRPMSREMHLAAGEHLFRRGDDAEDFYYITRGTVRLVEIGVLLKRGDVSGFMGLLSPSSRRTMSARCETAVELLAMHNRDFQRLYYQNPDFAIYLARLMTRRFIETLELTRPLQPGSAPVK
jgi:CRP/FNR family transcriptional regulator, cyclic AMP receptor protein